MSIKIFNERTELVHVTTHNVLHNLLMGMGLVIADPVHFPGRPRQRGDRGDHDPAGAACSRSRCSIVQGKSANLLSIGAVDFGIIVDSSVIIVENIYRHITAPGADRIAAAYRPDHRGVARDRAVAVLLDDDHRLRVHPAVLDDRPRRGALRADGQHLCLCDLRRPADGGDAGAGPLLVSSSSTRQEEAGHDARPAHEAALSAEP